MAEPSRKSEHAFRTIGELAGELGVPQHILRYWETRFPQLRPLQRAGNRRYYRPDDVALARRIHRLLNQDGYTIRGVQQLLAKGERGDARTPAQSAAPAPAPAPVPIPANQPGPVPAEQLRALRRHLLHALEETEV
jgi:DNA-binding transcriptional MerR regulator